MKNISNYKVRFIYWNAETNIPVSMKISENVPLIVPQIGWGFSKLIGDGQIEAYKVVHIVNYFDENGEMDCFIIYLKAIKSEEYKLPPPEQLH